MKAVVTFRRNGPVDKCGELGGRTPFTEIFEADLDSIHVSVVTDDGGVVAAGDLAAFVDLSSLGIQAGRNGAGL